MNQSPALPLNSSSPPRRWGRGQGEGVVQRSWWLSRDGKQLAHGEAPSPYPLPLKGERKLVGQLKFSVSRVHQRTNPPVSRKLFLSP